MAIGHSASSRRTLRRVIAILAVAAFVVLWILGPAGNHLQGCAVCGLKRRASYFLGMRYWTSPSLHVSLHHWYLTYLDVPHEHEWNNITGYVSRWGCSLHYDGVEPAYVLGTLASRQKSTDPETFDWYLREYERVVLDPDARREFFKTIAASPLPRPDALRGRSR